MKGVGMVIPQGNTKVFVLFSLRKNLILKKKKKRSEAEYIRKT
jgi:hypothetical protein